MGAHHYMKDRALVAPRGSRNHRTAHRSIAADGRQVLRCDGPERRGGRICRRRRRTSEWHGRQRAVRSAKGQAEARDRGIVVKARRGGSSAPPPQGRRSSPYCLHAVRRTARRARYDVHAGGIAPWRDELHRRAQRGGHRCAATAPAPPSGRGRRIVEGALLTQGARRGDEAGESGG